VEKTHKRAVVPQLLWVLATALGIAAMILPLWWHRAEAILLAPFAVVVPILPWLVLLATTQRVVLWLADRPRGRGDRDDAVAARRRDRLNSVVHDRGAHCRLPRGRGGTIVSSDLVAGRSKICDRFQPERSLRENPDPCDRIPKSVTPSSLNHCHKGTREPQHDGDADYERTTVLSRAVLASRATIARAMK
jgi:hypothetical protein